MAIKLSHSAVRVFGECARRYKLHYVDRLRPKLMHSALVYGSAIDRAVEVLLKTKNLEEASKAFDEAFTNSFIQDTLQYVPDNINIVYAERDFDGDLLTLEDEESYKKFQKELGFVNGDTISESLNDLKRAKKSLGFLNMEPVQRKLMNFANWLSLRRKGHYMIRGFNDEVVPKIKQVLATQKEIQLSNGEDSVTGFLDLAVEWEDGKRYLLDLKTSTKEYEEDAAMRSQQLILYYHASKEEFKFDGVGFIVLYKGLIKDKAKICRECGYDGSGGSHRTCPATIADERCGGEWYATVNPKCKVEVLLSEVSPVAEDLVLETFDDTADSVKRGVFPPNLQACKQGALVCPFFGVCWKNDKSEVYVSEAKK